MSSNRVSGCRASEATRKADKPDSPTVKQNEGMEEKQNEISNEMEYALRGNRDGVVWCLVRRRTTVDAG